MRRFKDSSPPSERATNAGPRETPKRPPPTTYVAALIEEKENALHAGLEAMYGDMADATFKALRRVMPITKLKMKWSVDALRLKGGLTRAAAEV